MARKSEGRGVWIHPSHSWSRDPQKGITQARRDLDALEDMNINLVIPLVKGTLGEASYPSKIIRSHTFERWDPLETVTTYAHDLGIQVYPWFCVFPEGEAQLKGPLATHPQWAVVDKKGKKFGYGDPAKLEVQQYETSVILEVLGNYDVDGVMLDYTRYPAPSFCYCDFCRDQFRTAYGGDPLELPDRGELKEKWDSWRREQVTSFVKTVSERIRSSRPKAKLGSYCWTTASLYNVYQDWPAWARRGYLDLVTPTGYVYDMDLFRSYCLHINIAIAGIIPTFVTIGVQTSHGKLRRGEVKKQIKIAREEGLDGVTLFHWEAVKRFLPEIRQAFAKPSRFPPD